ncbi:MAG: COX15/CtaA family protein [Pyrinomonadaceae bacterium]
MNEELKLSRFAGYAWFVLAYNVVVIIWGAFLRASLSGDGCGQHWLTCGGEIVPSAPQFKTIIEFSHRVSTGLAFFVVLILFVWAFKKYKKNQSVRKAAFASFVFIVAEALIGAGLVLTGNTAENLTASRPFWMAAHLITTFSLLAVLTLTAWLASGGKSFEFGAERRIPLLLAIAVFGIFLVGMSGSVAALSSMLFPSATLAEGVAKDFSETSNILLRLRVSHPILSVSVGVYLIFLANWIKSRARENLQVNRWTTVLTVLIGVQFLAGAFTFLMLAPIVLQLVHLLLADAVWVAFVLMAASILADENFYTEKEYSVKAQSALKEMRVKN